jgi:hypothetical protein
MVAGHDNNIVTARNEKRRGFSKTQVIKPEFAQKRPSVMMIENERIE